VITPSRPVSLRWTAGRASMRPERASGGLAARDVTARSTESYPPRTSYPPSGGAQEVSTPCNSR
jgi:hypothetical protein